MLQVASGLSTDNKNFGSLHSLLILALGVKTSNNLMGIDIDYI